jgi:hypothetical protein
MRKNLLRSEMERGNMMVPGKTIEIAGQTFGPQGPKPAWRKPIELTTRRKIVAFELFFCDGTHERYSHLGIL